MNKLFIFFKTMPVVFATILFFSCGRPAPSITFLTPTNDREYYKDEDIPIKVMVGDCKGKDLNVGIYAGDSLLKELTATPYYYDIPAGTLNPGKHTIKVIVETKSGKKGESVIQVNVKNEYIQSADFFSFFNGTIPSQWNAIGWEINSRGVDDLYYISTQVKDNSLYTLKKCNKISFYLKGWGEVQFLINMQVFEKFLLRAGDYGGAVYFDQPWTRYEFTFPTGLYSFTWKCIYMPGSNVGLDLIMFSTVE